MAETITAKETVINTITVKEPVVNVLVNSGKGEKGDTGAVDPALVGYLSQDLTGVFTRTGNSVSFVTSTRIFSWTIAIPVKVYYRGTEYTVSGIKFIEIPDVTGGNYIIYNYLTGQLALDGAYGNIRSSILIGYVYWDSVLKKAIIAGDERHSVARDTQWHYSEHRNRGAVWRSGGELSYTLNSDTNVNLTFSSPIQFADEDLEHSITDSASPVNNYEQVLTNALLPTVYLNGSGYAQLEPALPVFPHANGGRVYYNNIVNGVGSLVEAGNSKFVTYYIVATNDIKYPVKLIMGHGEYNNANQASGETFENYGLPVPEMFPMYKLVLQTSTGYTGNASKVIITSVTVINTAKAHSFLSF
jgi:hypothetical protein